MNGGIRKAEREDGHSVKYSEFLKRKTKPVLPAGVEAKQCNANLLPFQSDITKWALRSGRAAIFADCGLGKTLMQLEWAHQMPGRVLILAPLAVSSQTLAEANKFGISHVCLAKRQSQSTKKITVTNYERLHEFNPDKYEAVVLDESSILKAYDGKTRTLLIDSFQKTEFRLACTATPAPNDFMELGNHSEFLGYLTRAEMLSKYFVHDGGETQKWRLKGHAQHHFWKWICSWAVMLQKPSDLDYEDEGFELPPLNYHHDVVESNDPADGMLFVMPADTLQERISARSKSIAPRVTNAAKRINATTEQWLVWCNLNEESRQLTKAITGAVEVKGSDTDEHKESSMRAFANGEIRVLVTKPRIAGFGMNFQNCHNVMFVGLSDSWEQMYQAVRRCWRFGQTEAVDVHIVTALEEGNTVANIKRKDRDAQRLVQGMLKHMNVYNTRSIRGNVLQMKPAEKIEPKIGIDWELYNGDCVDFVRELDDESIGYSIFSPPFASLYTYSDNERDMGNCTNENQFLEHFDYLTSELYRVTQPGRLVSVHCMDLPTSKQKHGKIGLIDFPGHLISSFAEVGFVWASKVTIWKDPVIAMQRTKALGLLWKQLRKDSAMSRMGIPDYVLTFRKPGENLIPISHSEEEFPVEQWQKWASPIWDDINPSDTLQYRSAREHKDERHIAPLQLEVIRRCIRLWSAPKDDVLSPFAGIGSEGYVALQEGRRFKGAELKSSYFNQAARNLQVARQQAGELFNERKDA